MDGQEYSQLTRSTISKSLITTLTPSALGLIKGGEVAKEIRRGLTPVNAWDEGTNIQTAMKADPPMIRAWLALQLAKCVKAVGAKRSLLTTEELTDACDAIIEEFPTLKIEEIVLVFTMLSRGKLLPKLYSSFLTRELMEAFRLYEGDIRADMLEKKHDRPTPPRWDVRNSELLDKEAFKTIALTEEDLMIIEGWKTTHEESKA